MQRNSFEVKSEGETPLKFKFTIVTEIPYEDVADLLCSALEGGSNYWYGITEVELGDDDVDPWKEQNERLNLPGTQKVYRAPFSNKGFVKFEDGEDGTPIDTVLNLESMEKGLKLMAEKYPQHFTDFRTENGDATTGDVFLQLCLFGDVIYA